MKPKHRINGKEKAAMLIFALCIASTATSISGGGNIQANIFYEETEKASIQKTVRNIISGPEFSVENFVQNVEEQKLEALTGQIKDMEGTEKFLADFSQWIMIEEIKTEKTKDGFFVSLLAAENGTFHPYFGFLNIKEKKIIWGEHSSAAVINAKNEENGFVQVQVKNTGEYPWKIKNNWINKANNKPVEMISSIEEVATGKSASLLFKQEEGFLLSNTEIGFDVIFK